MISRENGLRPEWVDRILGFLEHISHTAILQTCALRFCEIGLGRSYPVKYGGQDIVRTRRAGTRYDGRYLIHHGGPEWKDRGISPEFVPRKFDDRMFTLFHPPAPRGKFRHDEFGLE